MNSNKNKIDVITSTAKSAVGAIPFVGALLSEIIGNIIPNQRIDRLHKYIEVIDEKISDIEKDKIIDLLNNEEFVDLIEEGFFQASRAITDDRRKYIANIVSNGITADRIELNESKYLLKILQELNDVEIIWLRSYLAPFGDFEYREKHKNILEIEPITNMNANESNLDKSAIQKSYTEHLLRLKLIENHYNVNHDTKVPIYNKFTNEQDISYTVITQLGKLILKQIGIIDDEKQ